MSDEHEDQLIGKILFKHYKLKKKIGEGSFGRIYIGVNTDTKEEYAIKLVSENFPFLFYVFIIRSKKIHKEVY